MTGKELQKTIIRKARAAQWIVGHFPPVRATDGWRTPVGADGKGFPDLMMLRDRVLVVEVKGTGDRLRPDQIKWLTAFRLCAGVEVHVWTPRELAAGLIDDVLARRGAELPA